MGEQSSQGRGNTAVARERDSAAERAGAGDPLEGTPYRALGKLGQGGMGLVLDAEHRSTGRPCVVKILHSHLTGHADSVDRMRLEGRALAALAGDPHVVAILGSGTTADGRPYLVMERLRGRTLSAERKARGSLPAAEAVELVLQVLAGLSAAHAAGIVHRDIKPANLFLCDAPAGGRPVLKVLDFGIAKLAGGPRAHTVVPARAMATEATALVGTLPYLAPEQAAGGAVDPRTDLYATGAVLFHLLAGQAPFEHHQTASDLLRAHLTEAPRAPSEIAGPSVPPSLDRAVMRALAKRPEERFQDAQSFADELAHIARALAPKEPEKPREAGARARRAAALTAVWFASMAATVAAGLALAEVVR